MATAGNSPQSRPVLELEARKSFSFGVWIQDQNSNPLDISGATLRFVARKQVTSDVIDDSDNLITNAQATIIAPSLGYGIFAFQASELDWTPGEYQFTIVIISEGYSGVLVNGIIQLNQNTEFGSMDETFEVMEPVTHLQIAMRNQTSIVVKAGPALAPNQAVFQSADRTKLDQLYAAAVAAGQILTADDIGDGSEHVMMTVEEREQLANLTFEWDNIEGKPDFGDIVTHDVSEFVQKESGDASDIATGVLDADRVPDVIDLNGISVITDDPVAGTPGHIYLKYTP